MSDFQKEVILLGICLGFFFVSSSCVEIASIGAMIAIARGLT